MRWIFTFGFLMVIPLGYNEFTHITWDQFTFYDYLLLFLIAVPGTFMAYVFNVYGIKILSASVAGTYIYLQPVFAVSFAIIFLHEELTFNKIIAAILIFTGVYLANYKRKM